MKVMENDFDNSGTITFYKRVLREKQFGYLGYKNIFLAKTIASFRYWVILISNYIWKFIFLKKFSYKDHLYFFMEYMNNGDLTECLERLKRLSEDQIRFYSAQILCGIQYLHSKNIIHRYFF